jgi:Rod binding domain-containing protein
MDLAALDLAGKRPVDRDRARAEQTAAQFEQLFVRTMVSSLRSTSSLGGEGGGMFGSGPGADTFADWFDQNLATQVARTSNVGIAEQLLTDLERHGEIPKDLEAAAKRAKAAADRSAFHAGTAGNGGIDVVLH